jgi:crotonobetainyl-CoA:carnitine CoA-transferase CaiB-like acyl-CoA transferase
MVTGFFAAYGILGALHERAATDKGRHVEVNMIDAMLAFGTEPIGRLFNKGDKSDPYTRGSFSQAFVFDCADGRRLGIHMSSPEKFWTGLLAAIERPKLAADPRFHDRPSRVANYKALGEVLMPIFRTQPRSHWMQRLDVNDVPFAPMYDLDELRDDPQIIELAPFVEMQHPVFGHVTGIKRPVRFDGDRMIDYRPPPALGEHTAEVLAECGIDQDRLSGLQQRKIV